MKVPPAVAAAVATPLVSALARTWRYRVDGADRWRQARHPLVFVLWHEALLPLLWLHRHQGVAIVVSENRDGQYLADYAARLGYRQVRGSSSRGAVRALLGAVRELREGRSVAFTPDGPRGPRRVFKPGVLAAAQRGGGTVVPVHADAASAWRLRSWDRFLVPKPFARVDVRYGQPFVVGPGEDGLAAGERVALAELARLVGEGA